MPENGRPGGSRAPGKLAEAAIDAPRARECSRAACSGGEGDAGGGEGAERGEEAVEVSAVACFLAFGAA